MKIILCLDDNNGMLFNNRRQSRDKTVIEDIISNLKNERFLVSSFSEKLFEEFSDSVTVDDDFLKNASDDNICFAENQPLKDFENITEITVYRWNRVYPADFYCDVDFSKFSLASETEFKGNSHDKITKQIFIKR